MSEDKITEGEKRDRRTALVMAKKDAEITRLREALKEISRQKTVQELMDDDEYPGGDFEYSHDALIKIARDALKETP